jgi:molecular chaperone GrpE
MNRRAIYRLRRNYYRGNELDAQFDHPSSGAQLAEPAAEQVREQEELVRQLQEQSLRLRADFENYRRRTKREQESAKKFANEELVKKLLVVMDDVERALASAQQSANIDAIVDGVQIIRDHFWSQLEATGLERIPSDGLPFDPTVHEAVSTEKSDEVEENHIISTFQAGYKLNDRVIRAAMVIVAKN